MGEQLDIPNYQNTGYDPASYDGQYTNIRSITDADFEQIRHSNELTRSDIISAVKNNIKRYNEQRGVNSNNQLDNDTIGEVIIPSSGIKHGLSRLKDSATTRTQLEALSNLPLYMKNAVLINEAEGRDGNNKAYILAGVYNNGETDVAVRMVVNERTREPEELNVLHALKAKKEGVRGQATRPYSSASTPSEISVADYLEIVKDCFPNDISGKLADYYGISQGKSDITGLKYTNYTGSTQGALSVDDQVPAVVPTQPQQTKGGNMIFTDVILPDKHKEYVMLDPDATVAAVLADLMQWIGDDNRENANLSLYEDRTGRKLAMEKTLKEQGIQSGVRLRIEAGGGHAPAE